MKYTSTLALVLALTSTGPIAAAAQAAPGGTSLPEQYTPPPEHYTPPPEHYTPKPGDDGLPETKCTKRGCP